MWRNKFLITLCLCLSFSVTACFEGEEGVPRICTSDAECAGSATPACNLITRRCVECTAGEASENPEGNITACDDGDPCTVAHCGATYLCMQDTVAARTSCDDENPRMQCNSSGECVETCANAGHCAGIPDVECPEDAENCEEDLDCKIDVCELGENGVKECAKANAAPNTDCDDNDGEKCNDSGSCVATCETADDCDTFVDDVCMEDTCEEFDGVMRCDSRPTLNSFEQPCDLSGEFGTGGGFCDGEGACVECMDSLTLCSDEPGDFCACPDLANAPLCDEVAQTCVECLDSGDCQVNSLCCEGVCEDLADIIAGNVPACPFVGGGPGPGGGGDDDDDDGGGGGAVTTTVNLDCAAGRNGVLGTVKLESTIITTPVTPVVGGNTVTLDFFATRVAVLRQPGDPLEDVNGQDGAVSNAVASGTVTAGGTGTASIPLQDTNVVIPPPGIQLEVFDVGGGQADVFPAAGGGTLEVTVTEAVLDIFLPGDVNDPNDDLNVPVACTASAGTATINFPIQ